MLKVISILIIVFTLFRFEFLLKFVFFFDAYQKFGSLRLYFFSFRILTVSIFIDSKESERGKIILKMGKKEKQLRFYDDEDGGDNSITVASLKKMFTNLLVSELVFEARVGDKNALNTIMLISSVRLIFYSTVSILKSRHNLNIHEKFIPCFNKDIFTMDAYGILNISLADIIFGIIMNAVEKDSKVELEEKGNSNDN